MHVYKQRREESNGHAPPAPPRPRESPEWLVVVIVLGFLVGVFAAGLGVGFVLAHLGGLTPIGGQW